MWIPKYTDLDEPECRVTIAHDGFAKALLADELKGEVWDAEEFRKTVKLLYDPDAPPQSTSKKVETSLLHDLTFGIIGDDGKVEFLETEEDDQLAEEYKFDGVLEPKYWELKRTRHSTGYPEEAQLSQWIAEMDINTEWEVVGDLLGKEFHFIDARTSGSVSPGVLKAIHCDELQIDLWTKYDHRIRNSMTSLGKLSCDLEESNYVGIMMDIECPDEETAARISGWLDEDDNLKMFDQYFAENAYPELGWSPQCKPFAMRNKAIFQTVAEPVPS